MESGPFKEGKNSSEFKAFWAGTIAPALTAILLSKGVPMEQATQWIVLGGGILGPIVSVVAYIISRHRIKMRASQPNEVTQLILQAIKEDPELRKKYVEMMLSKGETGA